MWNKETKQKNCSLIFFFVIIIVVLEKKKLKVYRELNLVKMSTVCYQI